MDKVGVIILNYNSFQETIDLVTHIYPKENNYYKLHIVVVDNASSDRTGEEGLVRVLGENNDCYIANPTNSGYAQGNNTGLRYLDSLGYDFCFIVNPDVKIKSSSVFFQVLDRLQGRHFALAGIRVGNVKPYIYRPSIWQYLFPFIYPFRTDAKASDIIRVYKVYGCFMLVNIPVFKRIGFFDPATFLYCEEDIVGEKLRKMNEPTLYVPDIAVRHSTSAITDKNLGVRKLKIMAHSFFYLLNKIRRYPVPLAYLFTGIGYINNVVMMYARNIFKKY
jgi:GT2 family glycosyltransferase